MKGTRRPDIRLGKCKDGEDKHCLIELLEEGEEGAKR